MYFLYYDNDNDNDNDNGYIYTHYRSYIRIHKEKPTNVGKKKDAYIS